MHSASPCPALVHSPVLSLTWGTFSFPSTKNTRGCGVLAGGGQGRRCRRWGSRETLKKGNEGRSGQTWTDLGTMASRAYRSEAAVAMRAALVWHELSGRTYTVTE